MATLVGDLFMLVVLADGWLGLREARRKGIYAEKMQTLILWGLLSAGYPVCDSSTRSIAEQTKTPEEYNHLV